MKLNNLCMGCMKEKSEQGKPCPYCGYDDTKEQNKKGMLPIWTILKGSYVIGKTLGDGGFGITYTGFDMNLEKKVAIKEYFPDGYAMRDKDGKKVLHYGKERGEFFLQEKNRYVEEARILAQIDEQPGVVKVINYFHENDTAYIVMEFLEGKSLKQYIEECGGKIPVQEALELMKPVIKALSGIHEKGVVHRDISPDNIMITSSGKVKLIDFGAAHDKHGNQEELRVYKERYSPIEQRTEDGEIGTYSDIYALCATIYYTITGEKLPSAVDRKHQDTLKKPSELGVEMLPIQEAALMFGLEVDADNRIKNATDLYYFLYVYGQDANASVSGMQKKIKESSTKVIVNRMQKEQKKRKSNRRIAIALGCLLIVGFLMIAVHQIARVVTEKKQNAPVVTTADDSSGKQQSTSENSEKKAVTEEELQTYKAQLYGLINEQRTNNGASAVTADDKYEAAATECVRTCTEATCASAEEWNSIISSSVLNAMDNQIGDTTGWVVLPYNSDFSIEQVLSDIQKQISTANQDLENAIDLNSCTKIGVAVGVHSDGTYFWALFYK